VVCRTVQGCSTPLETADTSGIDPDKIGRLMRPPAKTILVGTCAPRLVAALVSSLLIRRFNVMSQSVRPKISVSVCPIAVSSHRTSCNCLS
jgi:hypothetical protein